METKTSSADRRNTGKKEKHEALARLPLTGGGLSGREWKAQLVLTTRVYPSSDGWIQQGCMLCHKARINSNIMDVQLTNMQQLFDAVMSIWTKAHTSVSNTIPWKMKPVLKAKDGAIQDKQQVSNKVVSEHILLQEIITLVYNGLIEKSQRKWPVWTVHPWETLTRTFTLELQNGVMAKWRIQDPFS